MADLFGKNPRWRIYKGIFVFFRSHDRARILCVISMGQTLSGQTVQMESALVFRTQSQEWTWRDEVEFGEWKQVLLMQFFLNFVLTNYFC